MPCVPIGSRFWELTTREVEAITHLFGTETIARLAALLRSRADDVPVSIMDAAYWKKGCSSLGRLRYAVVLGIDPVSVQREYCLMDVKEAIAPSAPSYPDAAMPLDYAKRVVEGARNLSLTRWCGSLVKAP